ncbi:DNA primase [Planctomonas psychrotolerans]|uniref:DNA primase n=1 Tax=Planctomonas psychrotolerans TaxID=2528712 RepID=UPI00123B0E53|nr:DNA primase [Planctomonas psychrotolerans]
MAGLIRKSDIDEVRARVNLADVVGEYVTLKSAGVGSMKGLCPFHDERSPSFHVRPQVGFYHCFGCGEGGDLYTFLQKMDHVTFADAVERMAARIGYQLHYEGGAEATDQGNRARLLGANAAAAEYFIQQLGSAEAEVGRTFLGERGFDAGAAARFGVGFAPKSWDALTRHLRGKGFTEAELVAAGLVSSGDRGVYDRFRGRLVWPIRDLTGATVGFGARKLFDDDKGPKYLNTPETPIYHKSQVLYGLDLAKRDIGRSRQVVVVEGYTDVMACHLAGVTTAIATSGTSFGVDHIKVLRRVLGDDSGLGEVIFTFDPDAAGQKAAMRAFTEEQRFAAQTYVAVAPEGLDPCDLRLRRGDDAVRRLISTKKPMFEFVIKQLLAAHNLETVEGRVSALRAAAPVVAEIRDPALRPGYARELAGWLGMDLTEVGRAVTAAGRRGTGNTGSAGRTGHGSGGAGYQGGAGGPSGPDHRGGDDYAPADDLDSGFAAPDMSLMQLPTDIATRLERDALMAMLQYPDIIGADLLTRASQVRFSNPSLAVVRDGIVGSIDSASGAEWLSRVALEVPEPFATLVKQLGVAPIPNRGAEEKLAAYVRGITVSLIDRDLLARKSELLGRLQRTDARSDPDRYREVSRELMSVETERRALRGD